MSKIVLFSILLISLVGCNQNSENKNNYTTLNLQTHHQVESNPDYQNFIIEDVKETSLFITPPATDPEASYPVYEIYVDEMTQIVGYKNNLDELAKGDNVKVWVQEKDKEPAEKIFVNE
ncbi:hypothetical protein [Gracilibacillus dipsosauri]|uniref:DUF3221 domain-containing protein n=1 Tax=Gracilibacillus dipsosauri TaxID=178340 RepID=A0A317KVR9_9BACI|nr:hypothetical protein [Gracilibacillus dipsosauri]PWU67274.1 hypothetical protein DLJ74_17050 [Gracilibacillus dipsosauri]